MTTSKPIRVDASWIMHMLTVLKQDYGTPKGLAFIASCFPELDIKQVEKIVNGQATIKGDSFNGIFYNEE